MVESAIFFPIIILAAMFTIYMMINMYSETVYQAKLNQEVRAKSMEKIGNASVEVLSESKKNKYWNEAENKTRSFSEGKQYSFSYIYGSGNLDMKSGRITGYRQIRNNYAARSYYIDEKMLIWI